MKYSKNIQITNYRAISIMTILGSAAFRNTRLIAITLPKKNIIPTIGSINEF